MAAETKETALGGVEEAIGIDEFGVGGVGEGALADEFAIPDAGFDDGEAVETPSVGDQFADDGEFDFVDGAVFGEIGVEQVV